MQIPEVLIVPGSNRSGSHNARLAGTLARELAIRECQVTRITLRDYELPIYDADLELSAGQPENARKLARLFHEHDAVFIVSPEYNASMPPLLKNALDWISRVKADDKGELNPYRDTLFALASASPGKFAGIRGLNHLRATLTSIGATVIPEQLSIGLAAKAFDDMDRLVSEPDHARMEGCCASALATTRRLSVPLL